MNSPTPRRRKPLYGTPLNARRRTAYLAARRAVRLVRRLRSRRLLPGDRSGGSIRVPASLCGVWACAPRFTGFRGGVLPFMPSVSTVGVVAADFEILRRVMTLLLRTGDETTVPMERIVLLADAFAVADGPVGKRRKERSASCDTGRDRPPAGLFFRYRRPEMTLSAATRRPCGICRRWNSRTPSAMDRRTSARAGVRLFHGLRQVKSFDRGQAMASLALCESLFRRSTVSFGPERSSVSPRRRPWRPQGLSR